LTVAPSALAVLRTLEVTEAEASPTAAALDLAESFAQRTGATAAEFLSAIGEGLSFVTRSADVVALCEKTAGFLGRGGAPAAQYVRSARSVIELGGAESFEKWNRVTRKVAAEGNAIVYDFLKLTPKVLSTLSVTQRKRISERIGAVLDIVEELADANVYVALE